MKTIVPIILVVISIAFFGMYTNKTYQDVKSMKLEIADYETALAKATSLQKKRDALTEKYKTFTSEDLTKLQNLLPDHVDNVRFINDISGMAKAKGMDPKGVKIIEGDKSDVKSNTLGPNNKNYGSISISFTVTAPYENFLAFLDDLEKSLRIVDITSLSFKSSDKGVYDFGITIRTYWLK